MESGDEAKELTPYVWRSKLVSRVIQQLGLDHGRYQVGKDFGQFIDRLISLYVMYLAVAAEDIARGGGRERISPDDMRKALRKCQLEDILTKHACT